MSQLQALLQNLKEYQPIYNAAEQRSLDAEEWSDTDWQIYKHYWAIADSFLTALKSTVDSGATVRLQVGGETLEVRSVDANCWMYDGAPVVKCASVSDAPRLYDGFRLDRVESLEVING